MTALPAGLAAGTYDIDAAHSTASFSVRHAGIAKVRGTIGIQSGTIAVGEDLESTSVSAALDATAVSTGDANRDAHLQGDDFWKAEANPVWSFASKSISTDGDDYTITGDLTINGVTKTVDLPTEFGGSAVDVFGTPRAGFESALEISRKEFGLTWNAALEAGGVMVGDKVKITLDISAVEKA